MMSLLLIVVQVCAMTLVGGDRYGDYAGVSMPHYSMEEGSHEAVPPAEDYIDRSPDSPMPFDYKYEEELQDEGNNLQNKAEEKNWHNPNKQLKVPTTTSDDYELQNQVQESVRKTKASRKNRRHRTRIKNKEFDRGETNYRQKAASKARNQKYDKDAVDIRNDYYANKGRRKEDNIIESDDINFRDTTEKVIKRKPRDRRIIPKKIEFDDDEEEDDDDELKIFDKDDMKHFLRDEDTEYPEKRRANSRRIMVERPPRPISEKSKMRNKNYPEYDDDYYVKRRANDMKYKLPDQLRRIQASTMESSPRPVLDFTHRLAKLPENTTEPTTKTTTTTETTFLTKKTILTYVASSKIASNSTELSLAEKSRLSIQKKAQRKEDVKNVTWTTKPPVLMQVTRRMQTLVMVEPPQEANLRSREIFEDSPERLAKAKKLMRRKLVANVRSIHDLTDNWDEMLCDYIDVSLLDGSPSISINFKLLLLSLILICFKYNEYIDHPYCI